MVSKGDKRNHFSYLIIIKNAKEITGVSCSNSTELESLDWGLIPCSTTDIFFKVDVLISVSINQI